jgi:hypothetical protein
MSMPTHREQVVLLQGELVPFDKVADSGRVVRMMGCARCGTKVWNEPQSFATILVVKPGTLDDMSWAKPVGNIWISTKAPWVEIDDTLANFPCQPPDRRLLFDAWDRAVAAG